MELFAQGNRSLHSGLPVAGMAIFLILTVIPCIAAADDNGAIANSEQLNNVNVPAATGSPSFNEPVAAAVKIPAAIKRGFYMTADYHLGDAALTACSKGYHMASIWELLDVATLNYHYKHPNAMKLADSGNGPPAGWAAWVRTGNSFSSNSSTPGYGNCNNWTSASASDYGSAVNLRVDWSSAPTLFGPWVPMVWMCANNVPVWCVSDVR